MLYETEIQFNTQAKLKMERSLAETGLIVPVQNQGGCGCCFAFSALAAISAAYARMHHRMILLSIQHIIDAISYTKPLPKKDEVGCLPSDPRRVFDFVMKYGVHLEEDYKFESKKYRDYSKLEEKEYQKKEYPVMKIQKYIDISDAMSKDLENAINQGQPVVATIKVGDTFRDLKPGAIYQGLTKKDKKKLKKKKSEGLHSVLVIGYGVDENGVDYLIIQNSWDTWWCDNGRGLIRRNLAEDLVFPVFPKLIKGEKYDKSKYEVVVDPYIQEELKSDHEDDDDDEKGLVFADHDDDDEEDLV